MILDTLIMSAYALVPIIAVGAFIPQTISVIKAKESLESFSFTAWGVWQISGLISLAYGVFHLQDFMFILTSSASVFCNALVLSIATYKVLCCPRFKVDTRIDHHIDNIADQMHDQRDEREYIQGAEYDRIIAIDHALIPKQPQTIQ